ncbi:MAG: flavin-containing monooxygenase [Myxococcota bacterium]
MTNAQAQLHAGTPFTDADDVIEEALRDLSGPALLCALVHMTGDPDWIRGDWRPLMASPTSIQSGLTEEQLREIRRAALPALKAFRDGGCKPVTLPKTLLAEMMEFLACQPLPDRLENLFFFDLGFDGIDRGAITWGAEISAAQKSASPVVVVGAGMAGIQAGIRLTQAGLPFTIIEKNAGPGGTWWENRYPGARVDVPSHQYAYSFESGAHWSEYFCQHPELRQYFTDVLDRHGLRPHCRFQTEVSGARWDETNGRWQVDIRDLSDGDRQAKTETLEARFVISAVGSLNIPRLPDIEGMETFEGASFHSTRWPEDLDYHGKRFALLGAGASGFQIAPTIAGDVEQLSIFQRTAQWVLPNPLYHEKVPSGEAWAMQHLPFYGRWLRFMMTYPGIGSGVAPFRIDPEHNDPTHRSVNATNAATRDLLLEWMHSQLEGRPDLVEKVIPNYPAIGKRALQDNGSWFASLKRDNVELVRTGIERITPEGILTEDGTLHPADILCYATGFKHNEFVAFDMIGRGGASLHAQWGDTPTAHLGITVPHFPNVFFCYGPGTNLAHSAGLFFHSEFQTMHAMDAINRVLAADAESEAGSGSETFTKEIEVKEKAHDEYVEDLVEQIGSLVWSHPAIQHSHYKNPDGKVYTLSPWTIDEYWEMAARVRPEDYIIR